MDVSKDVFGAVRGGAKLSLLGISTQRTRSMSAKTPRPPPIGISVDTTY